MEIYTIVWSLLWTFNWYFAVGHCWVRLSVICFVFSTLTCMFASINCSKSSWTGRALLFTSFKFNCSSHGPGLRHINLNILENGKLDSNLQRPWTDFQNPFLQAWLILSCTGRNSNISDSGLFLWPSLGYLKNSAAPSPPEQVQIVFYENASPVAPWIIFYL